MTVAKTFSVSHWNIQGLHDDIFGCKLQSAEFLKNISKRDIVILTETWGCSHDISIPNSEVKIIPPNKLKNKKSGRSSGGVIVLNRTYLKNRIEVTKVHSNYVWLKLKDYYSFNTLIDNTKHLNICAIYIPPETSPYFSGVIFDNIRDDINTFSNYDNPLMICGDLNAQTSNLQDFISDIDKHNIHDSVTVQTDTP